MGKTGGGELNVGMIEKGVVSPFIEKQLKEKQNYLCEKIWFSISIHCGSIFKTSQQFSKSCDIWKTNLASNLDFIHKEKYSKYTSGDLLHSLTGVSLHQLNKRSRLLTSNWRTRVSAAFCTGWRVQNCNCFVSEGFISTAHRSWGKTQGLELLTWRS